MVMIQPYLDSVRGGKDFSFVCPKNTENKMKAAIQEQNADHRFM